MSETMTYLHSDERADVYMRPGEDVWTVLDALTGARGTARDLTVALALADVFDSMHVSVTA